MASNDSEDSEDSEAGSRKALAYARVGSDASDGSERSDRSVPAVELQLAYATAYAKLNGFDLVEDVVDEGVSGSVSLFARPGLRSALLALSSGEASALAISGVDRISRDDEMISLLFDCAHNDGWQLLVPGVNANCADPIGRFILKILSGLDRLNQDMADTHPPAQPDPPVEPDPPAQPDPPVEPDPYIQSVQAGQYAQPAQSDQPVEPDSYVPPVQSVQADQYAQPAPPVPPVQPAQPAVVQNRDRSHDTQPVRHAQAGSGSFIEQNRSLTYLKSWRRALVEHTNGVSVAVIAEGFNKDGLPLPGGRKNAHLTEWSEELIATMVAWPEGVRLFERVLVEYEQGRTFAEIAQDLNDDGMPTATGKQWNTGNVGELLSR